MPAAALVFILSLHREVGDRPQNSAGCERGNDEPKENIRRQFVHEIDDADRNEITEDEEYDIIDFPNFTLITSTFVTDYITDQLYCTQVLIQNKMPK